MVPLQHDCTDVFTCYSWPAPIPRSYTLPSLRPYDVSPSHGSYASTTLCSDPCIPLALYSPSLLCFYARAIFPLSAFVPLSSPSLSVSHSIEMQEQASTAVAAVSLPSSSDRSSSSALHLDVKEGMESDEEIRRVPELGGESAGTSASGRDNGSRAGSGLIRVAREGQRKRGRSPADRESKRLKRLLRNRVSAQQARERKKAYLSDLETRVKELEKKNSELEERLSTVQKENQMLRQILKNTTASRKRSSSSNNADGSQ